jgi:hypothetical protein
MVQLVVTSDMSGTLVGSLCVKAWEYSTDSMGGCGINSHGPLFIVYYNEYKFKYKISHCYMRLTG